MNSLGPGGNSRKIIVGLGAISALIPMALLAVMYLISAVEEDSNRIHRDVVPELVDVQTVKLDLVLAEQSLTVIRSQIGDATPGQLSASNITLARQAEALLAGHRDAFFDERLMDRAMRVFKANVAALEEAENLRQQTESANSDVLGKLDQFGQGLIDLINSAPVDSDPEIVRLVSGVANQADATLQLAYQSLASLDNATTVAEVRSALVSLGKSVDGAFRWVERNRDVIGLIYPEVFDNRIRPAFEVLRQAVSDNGSLGGIYQQRALASARSLELVDLCLDYIETLDSQVSDKAAELELLRDRLMLELGGSFTFSKWSIGVLAGVLLLITVLIARYLTELVNSTGRLLERKITERTLDLESSKESLVRALDKERKAQTELIEKQSELYEANRALTDSLEKLKQTQALMTQQEKLASIGHLAAGVAHEINNPLGFILSNINRLNEYVNDLVDIIEESRGWLSSGEMDTLSAFAGKLTEAIEDRDYEFIRDDLPSLIDDCVEGGVRVKEIIQNLKDFSRTDHAEARPELRNLNELIRKTLNLLKNETKYVSEVELTCPDGLELEVLPGPFSQVISNLVINAVHAIKKAGSAGMIRLTVVDDPDSVRITVSDNGCGIAREHINRIFDPFFTTKKVGEGTGLGMNISYDIITNRHGGRISVASEPGEGTEFLIQLPKRRWMMAQEALSA